MHKWPSTEHLIIALFCLSCNEFSKVSDEGEALGRMKWSSFSQGPFQLFQDFYRTP